MNQILKPTLIPQDIVLHVDDTSEDSYTLLNENTGFTFPAIKFRNTVIHFAKINRFDLAIGSSFLPQLSVSFSDNTNSIVDTDYPIQDDKLTILVGNTSDSISKPIHSDYLLTSINQNKSTKTISASGSIDIPNWKASQIRSFGEVTKFEAIKSLCTELGLGLISNISNSNDKDYQNQYGISNSAYLEQLCDSLWVSEDVRVWSFIDAHYNLHVIDLLQMISQDKSYKQINFDLRTGEKLTNSENIVVTNDTIGTEHTQFRISDYVPINSVGQTKQTAPTAILHNVAQKNYQTLKMEDITFSNLISDKSTNTEIDIVSSFEDSVIFKPTVSTNILQSENSFKRWSVAHNQLGRRMVLNSMNVKMQLTNSNNVLYIGQFIPVEIFNSLSGSEKLQKDSDSDNNASIEAQSNRGDRILNEMFSGWYAIIGMNFSYNGSEIIQNLLCTKRFWNKQYYELNK